MVSDPAPVIAIVGAGFSGTLLASQLLRQAQQPLRLVLIDRSGRFGSGVAYGTEEPGHLLNVSAGAMSAWPDDPSHLLRWLELNRSTLSDLLPMEVDASCFLPRMAYGLYLESVLKEAESLAGPRSSLERLGVELRDLEPLARNHPEPGGYQLLFDDRPPLVADHVVLALGNSGLRSESPASPSIRQGWSADACKDLAPDATVALLGSGLTMVDMLVSLERRGHRGPIVAMSRHGYQPNAHQPVEPIGDWLNPATAPRSVLGLWRLIRQQVAQAASVGLDWRAVMDGLRPRTQQLWEGLDATERRRFLRHAAVIWDIHRHRIAPALRTLLDDLKSQGRLEIMAARLLDHTESETGLRLSIRRRGTHTQAEIVQVDRLILCTGIPLDYSRDHQGLVSRLRERKLIQPDSLGLGMTCGAAGGLLNPIGLRSANLYTIGSPRKGQLWESIAVPELRLQALDLAQRILALLPRHLQSLPPLVQPASKTDGSTALLLRQLFDAATCTYTYLIDDAVSGEAALVDPVLEQLDRDLNLLQELGLTLRVCMETHLHADHITAAGQLRRKTGCRLAVPAAHGIRGADQLLRGGEQLQVGAIQIDVIATPGHTPEHVSYRIGNNHLFSGDALLIRGCGRTDFQNGDPAQLYDSLQRLMNLPDTMLVYPCHEYQGRSHTTIGEERRLNPKLVGRNREAFVQLMQQQRLAPPKRIGVALPANLHLGDLHPAEEQIQDRQVRQRLDKEARDTEEANREIYNDYLGMYI